MAPGDNNSDFKGILGLGPSHRSRVLMASMNTKSQINAQPVLERIFSEHRTTLNYMTVLLGRSTDPMNVVHGAMTVNELLLGYEAIANEPKLKIAQARIHSSPHWQISLDKDGILGSDGNPLHFQSEKTRYIAVLDTGFTLPQVPEYVCTECNSYRHSLILMSKGGF